MIDISEISLQFGGKYLFQNASFKINSGDKGLRVRKIFYLSFLIAYVITIIVEILSLRTI